MKPTTFLLAALPLLVLAQGPSQKISFKVNLGGGPVGDFLGEEQALDMSAFSKNIARVPIQNTDQAEIFQSQRFARASDFTMRIPVPDGVYSVTLLFAETFRPACVPGARVFDISLGTPVSGLTKVIEGFDVFQAAGCASAHGKRFDGVPSKEGIVVHLSRRAQHPSLAGFIVEGYPVVKGDGSEYKAIARAPPAAGDNGFGIPGAGDSGSPGMPGSLLSPGTEGASGTADAAFSSRQDALGGASLASESQLSAQGMTPPGGPAPGMPVSALASQGMGGDVGTPPALGRDAGLPMGTRTDAAGVGVGAVPAAPAGVTGGMDPGVGASGPPSMAYGRRRLLEDSLEEEVVASIEDEKNNDSKLGSRRLNGVKDESIHSKPNNPRKQE